MLDIQCGRGFCGIWALLDIPYVKDYLPGMVLGCRPAARGGFGAARGGIDAALHEPEKEYA